MMDMWGDQSKRSACGAVNALELFHSVCLLGNGDRKVHLGLGTMPAQPPTHSNP